MPITDPVEARREFADTTDAMVWAEEFCFRFADKVVDVGLMVGWFANAIEAGKRVAHEEYDRGYSDGQRDTSHALMGLGR